MAARHQRTILTGIGILAVAWALAVGGYHYFKGTKVTAEKVADYLRTVRLDALSGAQRQDALAQLTRQISALPVEERRKVRLAAEWRQWFSAMSEQEKGNFIEATLPSGFRQMLQGFDQMPPEKRKKAVEDALRDLKRLQDRVAAENPKILRGWEGTNQAPDLSPELQQRMVNIGLKSFYSESSAQAKAELAPVLEEMQRVMESGRLFRPHP